MSASAPQKPSDDTANPEWWHVAGVEFCRLLDARNAASRRQRAGKPDWQFLNNLALDYENVAVCADAMGFTLSCGLYAPRSVKWWPEALGPVWMMGEFPGGLLVAIDLATGRWRTPDNANRGESLIDLGAWRWGCRYGVAGHRIARLCGWARTPLVPRG